jgi:uncharacterized delta-60 repeat protein
MTASTTPPFATAIRLGLCLCLALLAAPANAATLGELDTGFGGSAQGRVRVTYNLGDSNLDNPVALRVIDDGRIVMVGYADIPGLGSDVAVSVRLPNGLPDNSIGVGGQYHFQPSFGPVFPGFTTAAIAGDGSFYIAATTGNAISTVRYALDGSVLRASASFSASGRTLRPNHAIVDVQGRLLVAGVSSDANINDQSLDDGFVTRLSANGAVDPAFLLRPIQFTPLDRDDVWRVREIGDERYVLCGRVGSFSGSLLLGMAVVNRDGSFDPSFAGTGMLFESVTVNSVTYDATCNDLGVVRAGGITRFLVTGRALSTNFAQPYVRSYENNGSLQATYGSAGTKLLGIEGPLFTSGDFPTLAIGNGSDDIGRAYVAVNASTAAGSNRLALLRLNSLGSRDVSFGANQDGAVFATFPVPLVGGTPKAVTPAVIDLAQDGIVLGGPVDIASPDLDFALLRFFGRGMFKNGFE